MLSTGYPRAKATYGICYCGRVTPHTPLYSGRDFIKNKRLHGGQGATDSRAASAGRCEAAAARPRRLHYGLMPRSRPTAISTA